MMAMPAADDYQDRDSETPDSGYVGDAANDQGEQSTIEALRAFMAMPNIASALESMDDVPDDLKLERIAELAIQEYKIDRESCDEWRERMDEALDLARLVAENKDYPFEGASNVKYPLIATAALQFNARAYSAIVQGNRIAKSSLWGPDPNGEKAKRGERVSEQLSYDCLVTMPEWEEDTDRLLLQVSILGSMFRKVWWDPSINRKCSRIITPDNLVINYNAASIESVPRITERLYLYPYEIQERIRDGRFLKFNYDGYASDTDDDNDDDKSSRDDKDAPQLFLEQHRMLDMDGDGYPEPYIVTVHYGSEKVCRVVANYSEDTVHVDAQGVVTSIRREDYYTKYQFLPSPDGGFYGWGFGWLLKDITESVNTSLNQLIDAGHIQNTQGGFLNSAVGIRERSVHLERGEWRVMNFGAVPANQAIVPLTNQPPSEALFKLLGLLVEAGKEIASIKDVLTGDTSATAPVGTTLALIEQGLQVFTSIFKRVFRGLKAELAIHCRLNKQYLSVEEYNDLVGSDLQPGQPPYDPKADFDMSGKGVGVIPVADPNTATRMQKLARAQATLTVADAHAGVVDIREAVNRFFVAMDEEDIDKLLPPAPQPDPEEEKIKRIIAELVLQEKESVIEKNRAQAAQFLALADGVISTGEIERARAILDAMDMQLRANVGDVPDNGGQAQPGGIPPMGGAAGNGMGNAAPPVPPPDNGAGSTAGAIPQFQPGGLPAQPA